MELPSYLMQVNPSDAARRLNNANKVKILQLKQKLRPTTTTQPTTFKKSWSSLKTIIELLKGGNSHDFKTQAYVFFTIQGKYLRDISKLQFLVHGKTAPPTSDVPDDAALDENMEEEGEEEEEPQGKGLTAEGGAIGPTLLTMGNYALQAATPLARFAGNNALTLAQNVANPIIMFSGSAGALLFAINYLINKYTVSNAIQGGVNVLNTTVTAIDGQINTLGQEVMNQMGNVGAQIINTVGGNRGFQQTTPEQVTMEMRKLLFFPPPPGQPGVIPPAEHHYPHMQPTASSSLLDLIVRGFIFLYYLSKGFSLGTAVASVASMAMMGHHPIFGALYVLIPTLLRKAYMLYKGKTPFPQMDNTQQRSIMPPLKQQQVGPVPVKTQQTVPALKEGEKPPPFKVYDVNDDWNRHLYFLLEEAMRSSLSLRDLALNDRTYIRYIYVYLTMLAANPQMFNTPWQDGGPITYSELNEIIMPNLMGSSPSLMNHLVSKQGMFPIIQRWFQTYMMKGQQPVRLQYGTDTKMMTPEELDRLRQRESYFAKTAETRLPTVQELENLTYVSAPFKLVKDANSINSFVYRIKWLIQNFSNLAELYSVDMMSNVIQSRIDPSEQLDLTVFGQSLQKALVIFQMNPEQFTLATFINQFPNQGYVKLYTNLVSVLNHKDLPVYLGIPNEMHDRLMGNPITGTQNPPPVPASRLQGWNPLRSIREGWRSMAPIIGGTYINDMADDDPLPPPSSRYFDAQEPIDIFAPTPNLPINVDTLPENFENYVTPPNRVDFWNVPTLSEPQFPSEVEWNRNIGDPFEVNEVIPSALPERDLPSNYFYDANEQVGSGIKRGGTITDMVRTIGQDIAQAFQANDPVTHHNPALPPQNISPPPLPVLMPNNSSYLPVHPQQLLPPVMPRVYNMSRKIPYGYYSNMPMVPEMGNHTMNFYPSTKRMPWMWQNMAHAPPSKDKPTFMQFFPQKPLEKYKLGKMGADMQTEDKLQQMDYKYMKKADKKQRSKDLRYHKRQTRQRKRQAINELKMEAKRAMSGLKLKVMEERALAKRIKNKSLKAQRLFAIKKNYFLAQQSIKQKKQRDIMKVQKQFAAPGPFLGGGINKSFSSVPDRPIDTAIHLWPDGSDRKHGQDSLPYLARYSIYDRFAAPFRYKTINSYPQEVAKPLLEALEDFIPPKTAAAYGGKGLKRQLKKIHESRKSAPNQIKEFLKTYHSSTAKFLNEIKLKKLSPALRETYRCWQLMPDDFMFFVVHEDQVKFFRADGNGWPYDTPEKTIDIDIFEGIIEGDKAPTDLIHLVCIFLSLLTDFHENVLSAKLQKIIFAVSHKAWIEKSMYMIPVAVPGFFVK